MNSNEQQQSAPGPELNDVRSILAVRAALSIAAMLEEAEGRFDLEIDRGQREFERIAFASGRGVDWVTVKLAELAERQALLKSELMVELKRRLVNDWAARLDELASKPPATSTEGHTHNG